MLNLIRRLAFLSLWLVLGLAPRAFAEDKILYASPADQEPFSLTEYFSILEDPTLTQTLADIQRPEVAVRFKGGNRPGSALRIGFTSSAIWLKLVLHNTGDRPLQRVMEIRNPRLANVQYFQPGKDGEYQALETGNAMPFVTRPFRNRNFVFSVVLPPHVDHVIYLRLHSATPIVVPGRLWHPEDFHAADRSDYVRQALYYGMAVAMVLFNFLLFVASKDRIYRRYAIYLACIALTIALDNGLVKEFLWLESPLLAQVSVAVGYSLTLAAALMFMRMMLDTANVLPKLDRFVGALTFLMLLIPVGLFLAYTRIIEIVAALNIIVILLILLIGVYCCFKRHRSAYFYVAAFGMTLIGGVLTGMRVLGLVATNNFTVNALQMGSAIEMVLLAFALGDRFNAIRLKSEMAQRAADEATAQLVANLRSTGHILETRIEERTKELLQANSELKVAYKYAESARQDAEAAHLETTQALDALRAAQAQMIQSEKMASLGKLVANVAHEVNTPIGAVKSSGKHIETTIDEVLNEMPRLFDLLDPQSRQLFAQLVKGAGASPGTLSTREQRAAKRKVEELLEHAGVAGAENKARILVTLGAHATPLNYLPLLQHPDCDFIFASAQNLGGILLSTGNIAQAVDRVSKIVTTLRSFSQADNVGEMVAADLKDGIDSVLAIYSNQIKQGTELELRYDQIPAIPCLPDELAQVWTHLIHNALQAMGHRGKLTISLRRVENEAVVSITDSGCGVAPEMREKIFEPFFTTRPQGEGSGLGLDVVKKIVAKHGGRIEVESEVGVGSTFSVFLPYSSTEASSEASDVT